jgi:hypothetical protein
MSKLYIRHRRHVGEGAGRPRFAIVASQGVDVRVYKTRVRRAELEKIAEDLDAEIVYLPRGERTEDGGGRRRRERAEA